MDWEGCRKHQGTIPIINQPIKSHDVLGLASSDPLSAGGVSLPASNVQEASPTSLYLLLRYFAFFREQENYDTDELGITGSVKAIIERDVFPRVKAQISGIVCMQAYASKMMEGQGSSRYTTDNVYNFGECAFALGDGTVATSNSYNYKWKKEGNCSNQRIYIEWHSDTSTYYEDVFRDITDIEGWIGLPVELGNDYTYYHFWKDRLEFKGYCNEK